MRRPMYKHTKVYSLKVEVKKKESETGVAACQVNIIKEVFVRTTLCGAGRKIYEARF